MLLRLAYLGITNAFALLRLLPGGDHDKDIEILSLRHPHAALDPGPGTAPGKGERQLGVSEGAWRTAHARDHGRPVHRLGDPARGRDRPGTRPGRPHLGGLPALPSRSAAGRRLHRDRDADRSADVRPDGNRTRQPPDPGPGHHGTPHRRLGRSGGTHLVMDLEDVGCKIKYLIRDRDGKYPGALDAILADAGIKVVLSGIQVPRMNAIMQRWVRNCRRELLDRTLI